MTAYGTCTYTFRGNGELLTRTDTANGDLTTYDYDVSGSLRHLALSDGSTIDYDIDGRHRRVGKSKNGVRLQGFLYVNQLEPVAELDGNGAVVAVFVYADRATTPSYMLKGGAVYRLLADHVGSVRLVVDTASGDVAQRQEYDEFGNVIVDTNPGFQPFGFAGGIYDRDTGFVRFGARDYDPISGRWTAKDPKRFEAMDTNFYSYAFSDPVNLTDPSGKDICTHRSALGYEHEWISVNNDPARSYGAWPESELFTGRQRIEHPDLRAKEIGSPETTTVCHKSSASEDQQIEDWINENYDLEDSSKNPRYIFGIQDCRSFVRQAIDQLKTIQGDLSQFMDDHQD